MLRDAASPRPLSVWGVQATRFSRRYEREPPNGEEVLIQTIVSMAVGITRSQTCCGMRASGSIASG